MRYVLTQRLCKHSVSTCFSATANAARTGSGEFSTSRKGLRRHFRCDSSGTLNDLRIPDVYSATGQSDDEEEWIGIQGSSSTKEQEYEDEEVLATVTVVEDFDLDTLIHGPSTPTEPSTIPAVSTSKPHPVIPKTRPTSVKKKVREKKIRYETKDARKVERTKQRVRRKEKAELAGGKGSRKARLQRKGNRL